MNKVNMKKIGYWMGIIISVPVILQATIILIVENTQAWASILCQNWQQLLHEVGCGTLAVIVLTAAIICLSYCRIKLSQKY